MSVKGHVGSATTIFLLQSFGHLVFFVFLCLVQVRIGMMSYLHIYIFDNIMSE